MNWDNQLSSVMTATDGSVAKIREHLIINGRLSRGKEDVHPVREISHAVGLDLAAPPPLSPAFLACSSAVQWGDLAVIQAQLHSQRQAIESLTQNLRSVERERNAQQRQIRTLQEEVRRLWKRLEEPQQTAERDPGALGWLEQLKTEVGQELSSLRGHINRAASLGNQEGSFRCKLHREEVEQLRREVEQLRSQLMMQEEDMYQQQTEVRETRRQYERSSKTLESLADSCCTHRCNLDRTVSQHEQTRLDVRELRLTVSELKDSVRDLVLRDRLPTTADVPQKSMAAVSVEMSPQRRLLSRSDSEDGFSPTPSLGEVSSDDLDTSWLGEAAPKMRSHEEDTYLSLEVSDISEAGSGLGNNRDDKGSEVEGVSDSSPDLSLSDL
ncbi:uncharacterized protein LOC113591320 isoform X2 [Electrophorus electricus]|uniref:uncharacterized protein LOC113591320 isoform X2 n=1 Tax=Electrophorus electricus TaxID=8005 RepID=UPI0015D08685|nr:uncharacterized protein LOC113591320 isoform X2 [Electrophorus electricus]